METKTTEFPPIENAADFVDALRKLPEDRGFFPKKPLPGRRMRDKFSDSLNQEKAKTPAF